MKKIIINILKYIFLEKQSEKISKQILEFKSIRKNGKVYKYLKKSS